MALRAILWKELREQYLRGGRPAFALVIMGVVDIAVGVVAPLAIAQTVHDRMAFLASAGSTAGAALAFTCLFLPMSVVIDTVAGERERHTLETLLASPARDRDIVLGKALAILVLVAAQALFIGSLCLVTWTIAAGVPGLVAAGVLTVGGLVVGAILASYTTGLGLLISQRAKTVKAGQQLLAYASMPFFLAPSLLGRFFVRDGNGPPPQDLVLFMAIAAFLVFIVLNATFWTLALAGFKRGRLLAK